MALREFRDRAGVEWRAWDITSESMHPVTAREMFVGRYVDFQEGWLVFESAHERRRLAPYPSQWADFSVDDLEALVAMATPSPSRLAREASGSFPRVEEKRALAENVEAAAGRPTAGRPAAAPVAASVESPRDAARSGDRREFVGPSGRRWTVALAESGDRAAGATSRRKLLRFTANDGTVCDLAEWPDDWPRFTTSQLMELLRHAEASHDVAVSGDQAPRRRREDRRP